MTGRRSGLGSWYRRRADAKANLVTLGGSGADSGSGFPVGRREPRIARCIAVGRGQGYELRISGAHLSAGAVPITGRVGGQRLSEVHAVGPGELTALVETCDVGDRVELDFGPFGVAVGSVERLERRRRRPFAIYEPLVCLVSGLRSRLGPGG